MFKNCNVKKKMSSILMSVIVCVTPVISGYAAESFENSGADEIRGGIDLLNYEIENIKNIYETRGGGISEDKDEDGYIVSGKWICNNEIIITLADNVLTISGNGMLPEYDVSVIVSRTICKKKGQM